MLLLTAWRSARRPRDRCATRRDFQISRREGYRWRLRFLISAGGRWRGRVGITRPYGRLDITRRTDVITTLLLLAIGVLVTEIAVRGRSYRLAAARRAGYLAGLVETTEAMTKGHSPSDLTRLVEAQLTTLLGLRACHYQSGVAGIGDPARLGHDGELLVQRRPWDVVTDGFPTDVEVELLVESHGALQGRFLMAPLPASKPDAESRRVAVALADNFGSALASV